MTKVLIAYGSKHGSTAEVAERLASVLRDASSDVVAINLAEVRKSSWPKPADFDACIIGSCIRIEKWLKPMRKYVAKHKEALSGKPLGIFVVSLSVCAGKDGHAKEKYVKDFIAENGLDANLSAAFGGVLDISKDSNLSGMMRKIMQAAADDMRKDSGLDIKENEKNDFRDWEQIEQFARDFSSLLKNPQ